MLFNSFYVQSSYIGRKFSQRPSIICLKLVLSSLSSNQIVWFKGIFMALMFAVLHSVVFRRLSHFLHTGNLVLVNNLYAQSFIYAWCDPRILDKNVGLKKSHKMWVYTLGLLISKLNKHFEGKLRTIIINVIQKYKFEIFNSPSSDQFICLPVCLSMSLPHCLTASFSFFINLSVCLSILQL